MNEIVEFHYLSRNPIQFVWKSQKKNLWIMNILFVEQQNPSEIKIYMTFSRRHTFSIENRRIALYYEKLCVISVINYKELKKITC